jgi:hypothetical protein
VTAAAETVHRAFDAAAYAVLRGESRSSGGDSQIAGADGDERGGGDGGRRWRRPSRTFSPSGNTTIRRTMAAATSWHARDALTNALGVSAHNSAVRSYSGLTPLKMSMLLAEEAANGNGNSGGEGDDSAGGGAATTTTHNFLVSIGSILANALLPLLACDDAVVVGGDDDNYDDDDDRRGGRGRRTINANADAVRGAFDAAAYADLRGESRLLGGGSRILRTDGDGGGDRGRGEEVEAAVVAVLAVLQYDDPPLLAATKAVRVWRRCRRRVDRGGEIDAPNDATAGRRCRPRRREENR